MRGTDKEELARQLAENSGGGLDPRRQIYRIS